ncbi:HD domain-containing protein [Usnea florida]
MESLIEQVTHYVEEFMSNYDSSHDFTHIQRVLKLAKKIEACETSSDSTVRYNSDIITLASLLHDVGDRKYLRAGEDGETMVERILLRFNADAALASEVQAIVNHVSYTKEVKDPAKVQTFLSQHRELGVVQDADRLDSIGAFGVARFFIYHSKQGHTIDDSMTYFSERLENLEPLMKTRTGRQMAAGRTRMVKEFRSCYEKEAELEN